MKRQRAAGLLLLAMTVATGCPAGGETPEPGEHAAQPPHAAGRVHIDPRILADAGIEAQAVAKHPVAPAVHLTGRVVADPDRRSRVAARLSGTIESTSKTPGEPVEQGDVIAVIRAPNLQSLRSASAALLAKSAAARANAERLDALVDKRMASKQEAVAARAEAQALEAEAKAARDRLRAIGVRGSGRGPVLFSVRAPTDGILVERPVAEGDPVTDESVVATVVGMDRVWFEAQIFERDLARLHLQDRANVVLNAYPDQGFEGAIEYISHQPEPGALTLTARIPLDNADGRLRLGLFGTAHVSLESEASEPVVAISPDAVTSIEGRDVVFTSDGAETFQVRPVRLGRRDARRVEVLEGLDVGEQVVTQGVFAVKSAMLSETIAGDHH